MNARAYSPRGFDADAGVQAPPLRLPRLVDADRLPTAAPVEPPNRITYVISFPYHGAEVRLRRPLRIELNAGEDTAVVAYAPAVSVGGAGSTVEAAVSDLCESLYLLWEGLRSASAPLDLSAEEVLKRLGIFLPA